MVEPFVSYVLFIYYDILKENALNVMFISENHCRARETHLLGLEGHISHLIDYCHSVSDADYSTPEHFVTNYTKPPSLIGWRYRSVNETCG